MTKDFEQQGEVRQEPTARIEECPELNLSNYDSVDVERLDSLVAAILNLPCGIAPVPPLFRLPSSGEVCWSEGYKVGHRDARHAAAELVASSPAAGGVPLSEEKIDELAEWHGLDQFAYEPFARAIEAAHGISDAGQQSEQGGGA